MEIPDCIIIELAKRKIKCCGSNPPFEVISTVPDFKQVIVKILCHECDRVYRVTFNVNANAAVRADN